MHWAVNGYLRDAVLARTGPEPGRADFEPRRQTPAPAPASGSGAAASNSPAAQPAHGVLDGSECPAMALPQALWEQILANPLLTHVDLCSVSQVRLLFRVIVCVAANAGGEEIVIRMSRARDRLRQVCRVFRAAASRESTWHRQFNARWGERAGAAAEAVAWCGEREHCPPLCEGLAP